MAFPFFYILSGLTLFVVYKQYSPSKDSLLIFATKRFFRIYPLLWMVTIVYVFAASISDPLVLFLNFSGLFGFIRLDSYIGTGVWSIGNELVFYAFFPLLMFVRNKNTKLFAIAVLLIFLTGAYFAFYRITDEVILIDQWISYINPFNQFYLFAGGMFIGHLAGSLNISLKPMVANLALLVLVLLFCLYPVNGDLVAIVTDWPRVVLSLICFGICFIIHVNSIETNEFGHRILSYLGATSYSIYLIHPIVYNAIKAINQSLLHLNIYFMLILSFLGTIVVSYLSYTYVEKPMILLGSRLASDIRRAKVS